MDDIFKIKDLDFLVHCGDMFHIPHLNNPHPPPEPARRVLKNVLDTFFENTDGQVPIIYVEGNHGVFRGYEYTPFESHFIKKDYPNLYYFKERDLINAIKSSKPLNLEFLEKNVRFYLFPYFFVWILQMEISMKRLLCYHSIRLILLTLLPFYYFP